MEDRYVDAVLDACLTAGKIMIESGSEMYRVEDTMRRIGSNAGLSLTDLRVFTTPTGLFMGVDKMDNVQIEQVEDRSINMEKVSRVNDLSRRFAEHKITLAELRLKLEDVDCNTPQFPLWLQTIGTGFVSSTLMVLFMNDYDWLDLPFAALIGMIGFLTYHFVKKYAHIRFLAEMLASLVLAFLAISLQQINSSFDANAIIIGGVMILVPGLALTNSLRDLFAGHLISGIGRGVEAVLTAVAIGGGVALVMRFMGV